MSLSAALTATAYEPARVGGECSIGKLYRSSTDDPQGQTALLTLLADPAVQHVEIAERLSGYGIGSHTVGRHRRGLCKCGPLGG